MDNTDFYSFVWKVIREKGLSISRKQIKELCLGVQYEQGVDALIDSLTVKRLPEQMDEIMSRPFKTREQARELIKNDTNLNTRIDTLNEVIREFKKYVEK